MSETKQVTVLRALPGVALLGLLGAIGVVAVQVVAETAAGLAAFVGG